MVYRCRNSDPAVTTSPAVTIYFTTAMLVMLIIGILSHRDFMAHRGMYERIDHALLGSISILTSKCMRTW